MQLLRVPKLKLLPLIQRQKKVHHHLLQRRKSHLKKMLRGLRAHQQLKKNRLRLNASRRSKKMC